MFLNTLVKLVGFTVVATTKTVEYVAPTVTKVAKATTKFSIKEYEQAVTETDKQKDRVSKNYQEMADAMSKSKVDFMSIFDEDTSKDVYEQAVIAK
tara:strand:- start:152 stop:439 length:288 start_codon:yes stop_codon:yes gene_type:complete